MACNDRKFPDTKVLPNKFNIKFQIPLLYLLQYTLFLNMQSSFDGSHVTDLLSFHNDCSRRGSQSKYGVILCVTVIIRVSI
jgi:hypothetical protein